MKQLIEMTMAELEEELEHADYNATLACQFACLEDCSPIPAIDHLSAVHAEIDRRDKEAR